VLHHILVRHHLTKEQAQEFVQHPQNMAAEFRLGGFDAASLLPGSSGSTQPSRTSSRKRKHDATESSSAKGENKLSFLLFASFWT